MASHKLKACPRFRSAEAKRRDKNFEGTEGWRLSIDIGCTQLMGARNRRMHQGASLQSAGNLPHRKAMSL